MVIKLYDSLTAVNLNPKSTMATTQHRQGLEREWHAGQVEVLTVQAARQSSRQWQISEGGLAVCGGRA